MPIAQGDGDGRWHIRRATPLDIPALVYYRCELFRSMGTTDERLLAELADACFRYMMVALPGGEFRAWVADAGDSVIACGAAVIHEGPPTPSALHGRQANIMNMYTRPEWRRKGIARALMDALVTDLTEAGAETVELHATSDGRPLYEAFGFVESGALRKRLP
jgi:ribosomal protein S18 acetylase RimI-like enzyme